MPTYIKHQAPSFRVNRVPGWDTRLIYCYYNAPGENINYVTEAGNYTSNLFSFLDNYKGTFGFGNRYFATGKNLRIKGRFIVSSTDEQRFNIYMYLSNQGSGDYYLASTNNDNGHFFANKNVRESVPVDYEILISSVESDDGFYLQTNGFYQYNYDSYNGNTDRNLENAYVPIWKSGEGGGFAGNFGTEGPWSLNLRFDSSAVPSIIPAYITIEELS